MKQHLKRTTALVLFAALVLGLMSGVPLTRTTAANVDANGNEIVNLLDGKNPSFEEYAIPNWTFSYGAVQSKEQAYNNSTWSLKLTDNDPSESVWAQSDSINTVADKAYTVSAMVYGDIGQMTVRFYDAEGTELTAEAIRIATTEAANQWQKVFESFTTPAGAAQLSVKVSSTDAGIGNVYFDAVTLEALPEGTVVPKLENGNFDAEWTGSMAPGWINHHANQSTCESVDDGNGGKALAVTKAAGVSNIWILSERTAVQPDVCYDFTMDIKSATSCQVWLHFYETETATSRLKSVVTHCVGDYSSDWTQVSLNTQAPANAHYAEILIVNLNTAITYFDNAMLRPSSIDAGILNPSFEECFSNYNAPSGWTTGSGHRKFQSNDSVSTAGGNGSISAGKSNWLYSNYINIQPGETYQASVMVKAAEGALGTARPQINFYFLKSSGTTVSVQSNFVINNDGWQELVATNTAPDDAVAAYIMLNTLSDDYTVCFDDVKLVQTTNSYVATNLLANGEFETRKIENKSPIPQWTTTNLSDTAKLAVDYVGDERGYVASYPSPTSSGTRIWSKSMQVTPGQTYSATVDVKGKGNVQLWIFYYANATDAYNDYLTDSNGKTASKVTSTSVRDDVWSNVTVTYTAPSNANYARVWIIGMSNSLGQLDIDLDNATFFNGEAALIIPGEDGVLLNSGFEELDEAGDPKFWVPYSTKSYTLVDANEDPENVFDGRYALKLQAQSAASFGFQSIPIPVTPGETYTLSTYTKEEGDLTVRWRIEIRFYDKNKNLCGTIQVRSSGSGEWNYVETTMPAPEDALYCTAFVVNAPGIATCYFDKFSLTKGSDAENYITPVMVDLNWSLVEQGHPRVYFDQERLNEMKLFAQSNVTSAYGYSGKVAQNALLTEANKYMGDTTTYTDTAAGGTTFSLYPVMDEITRVGGYGLDTSRKLQDIAEVLSLSYLLTGEQEYADRAIHYALSVADWETWATYDSYIANPNGAISDQVMGDFMLVCSTVYDMCYDQLTAAERTTLEEAIITKGMELIRRDIWARCLRQRDTDHTGDMVISGLAIVNENNINRLKPYFDMGMTYVNWRLDHFMYSGINEGHDYDALAIDDVVLMLDTYKRITGYEPQTEHPYMEQLEKRVLGFFDPANGTLPAYGDDMYGPNYPVSMATLALQGNDLAAYYIALSDLLDTPFLKLVYFTDKTAQELVIPDDSEYNTTYVNTHGLGALRTGFGVLDSMMVINANNSTSSHNHYDQNSIQLAFNGRWLLTDTQYKNMSYNDQTTYQEKYTNSTIFVDGLPQTRVGQGSLDLVFDSTLYGYFIGSAPDAYGLEDKLPKLNKFERHAIMVNHSSHPYYLVIDDLESSKNHTFGWNFYTNGWDRLEMDGQLVGAGTTASGNRLTLSKNGNTLHSYFVSNDELTARELSYAGYGPTLLVEGAPSKNYQFMNIISMEKGSAGQVSASFAELMDAQSSTAATNNATGGITWSTRRGDTTKTSVENISIGSSLVMFRGGVPGDWIKFPFTVATAGDYSVTIDMGRSLNHGGHWNVYVDSQRVNVYQPNGTDGIVTIDAGTMNLTAGEHFIKLVLSGTTETAFDGITVSCAGVNLDNRQNLGVGAVQVTETYDNENVLGAAISYGTVLSDLVIFNRGTASVTAGNLTTNGKQASLLGLYNGQINEGYAVTNATSLSYGELQLLTADGAVSVAVDFTLAKQPIKNTADNAPVELPTGFDAATPVINVSSDAEADRVVSIYVGDATSYAVTIDGVSVTSSYANGMVTLTIPSGNHQIQMIGTP